MITYAGLKNGRPSFAQSEEDDHRNRGCMPKWLIKALDDGRLRVVDGKLKAGNSTIEPGQTVSEQ